MSDNGAGHPGARALAPSAGPREAPAASPPIEAAWAGMATAPTLVLPPRDAADEDDSGSTSRIVTSSTMPPENPQWFRTGTTVPPPSMRPLADSAAPSAVREPPNPRVLRVVAGVIGACLFIVAIAGAKLLYKRSHALAISPPIETPILPITPPATADLANTRPAVSESAPPGDLKREPETAPSHGAPPSSAAPAAKATRRTRGHASPNPARVMAKPATPRAPVPKKVGKSTH